MNAQTERVLNILGTVVGLAGLPALGWAWNLSNEVTELRVRLIAVEEELHATSQNTTDIRLVQKDVEYISENLAEIRQIMRQLSAQTEK
jgi:hypothetical protein